MSDLRSLLDVLSAVHPPSPQTIWNEPSSRLSMILGEVVCVSRIATHRGDFHHLGAPKTPLKVPATYSSNKPSPEKKATRRAAARAHAAAFKHNENHLPPDRSVPGRMHHNNLSQALLSGGSLKPYQIIQRPREQVPYYQGLMVQTHPNTCTRQLELRVKAPSTKINEPGLAVSQALILQPTANPGPVYLDIALHLSTTLPTS